MEIVTNTYVKKGISKKIGMKSPSQINSGLAKFEKAKLVRCVESGVYRMNPEFFGTRAWAEIQKIKIEHCFSNEANDIHIIVEYGDGQVILSADQTFWDQLPVDNTENEEEDTSIPDDASDIAVKEDDPADNEDFPPIDIPDDLEGAISETFPDCVPPYLEAADYDKESEFLK